MKKTAKKLLNRTLASVLTVLMLFSAIPFSGLQMKANAVSHTASEAMSWCESLIGSKVGSGQCVALIQAYYSYLGVSPVSGNACDYKSNALPSGWTRVQGGVPQKGDILVYVGATYGHVAIYAGGTTSYHQNMKGKFVEKKTSWAYNNSWYSTAEGGTKYYWGYIRPNFSSQPAHTRDTKYGTEFKAIAKSKIDVFNSDGSDPGNYYIDAGDVCTIHEVYTDGWCYVSYPSSVSPTGERSYYAKIADFTFGNNPKGCVDSVYASQGQVHVTGWAFDEDDINASLNIHVYIGSEGFGWIYANKQRTDVNKVYNCGNNHGFDESITTSKTGEQKVEIYAINVGNGDNVLLYSGNINISPKTSVSFNKTSINLDLESKPSDTVAITITGECDSIGWDDHLTSIYGVEYTDMSFRFTAYGEGDGKFTLKAYDSKGNVLASADLILHITGPKPEIVLSKSSISLDLQDKPTDTLNVSFKGNASYVGWDDHGALNYSVGYSNGTFTFNALRIGNSKFTVSLYDENDNVLSTKEITLVVTGDKPVVSFDKSSVKLDVTNSPSTSVGVSITDGYSYFKWETSGSDVFSVENDNLSFNITALKDGTGSLTIKTYDTDDVLLSTYSINITVTKSYTVKFNGNGSTSGSMSNQSFTYGTAKNLTANAFKKAYTVTYNYNGNGSSNTTATANATFNGWATSSSGSVVYTDKQSVNNLTSTSGGTVNLYANWTNGSVTLPSPTRTGYAFGGWYTAASGGTKVGSGAEKYTPSSNITLYAHWTANTYTVSYNANGGTGVPSAQTKTYGTALTLSSVKPSKSYTITFNANGGSVSPTSKVMSYTFNNWKASDGTIYSAGGSYTANASTTLTAQWTSPSAYTLPTPTKTGYAFAGWNTKSDGAGTTYTAGAAYTNTSSATLYAQWTLTSYSISYVLNGGTVSATNPSSYNVTTADFTLNNPIRIGYTFAGWTGTGLSSATKTVTVSKGSTGNRSYTATWTANGNTAYKVNHYQMNTNGSGYTLKETESKTGTSASSVTIADLKKSYTGFTYEGGKGTTSATATKPSSFDTTTTVLADGTRVINIYYSRNKYALTLSKGTGISAVTGAGTYYYGQSVSIDATVSTGYTWSKWSDGNTTKSRTYTMPASAATLTASATANSGTTYKVNHYQMNTNGSGYTLKETENKTGTSESSVTIADLKKSYTGFTYEGGKGTTSATATKPSSFDTTTTVLADGTRVINIYYSRNKYALTLSKGTGISAVTGAGTYYYGQSVSIDATVSTGYTWSKWSDGNTTKSRTYTMPASAATLTASAAATKYTISYNLNGGTATSANPTSYSITTDSFTLNNPTRTGYIFVGWTGTGLSSATTTVIVAKGSTGSRSYTATWAANTYTVIFNANGGTTSTTSKSVTYDSSYGTLPVPTRAGYTFSGWYTDANGGTKVTADTKVNITSSQTLYAHWSGSSDTGYTVEHYVMGTNGSYPTTATQTESRTGATGTSLTLSSLKLSSLEVANGITYANGSVGGSTVTTTTIAADGSTVIKLYYSRSKYALTLSKGTGISAVTGAGTYYYGQSVSIDATVSTGYTWSKWSDGNTTKSRTYTMPAGAATLTASAAATKYTISYNLNGGTATNPTEYYVTTADFTLNNPTRTGYAFAGWTGTGLSSATMTVTVPKGSIGNRSYTATWTVITYDVTVMYNANGGTVSPASKTVEMNSSVKLPTPSKSYKITYNANGGSDAPESMICGVECKGWSTSSSAISAEYACGASYVAASDTTLYAVWENNAGGSITTSEPFWEGHVFLGWSESRTATSATYKPGEEITLSKNTTLYAVWKTEKVKSVSISGVEVKYKKTAKLVPVISIDDGISYTVKYESSNPSVVTVDDYGNITTHHKGDATITCIVTDEFGNVVKDACNVNVYFSFGQWLIWILLLGFLWY